MRKQFINPVKRPWKTRKKEKHINMKFYMFFACFAILRQHFLMRAPAVCGCRWSYSAQILHMFKVLALGFLRHSVILVLYSNGRVKHVLSSLSIFQHHTLTDGASASKALWPCLFLFFGWRFWDPKMVVWRIWNEIDGRKACKISSRVRWGSDFRQPCPVLSLSKREDMMNQISLLFFFHHFLCNILHFSRMVKKYRVRAWGLHFMADNFQISPKSWHRNGRWPLGAWQWRRMASESSTVMVRNTSYKSVITSFLWNDKPM